MAKPPTTTTIELPPLNLQRVDVPIVGDSPLLVHAWSHKQRQAMLDKQMKKASVGKAAKDPWQDFCESLYWMDAMPPKPTEAQLKRARFGFPSVAFKSAAVTAVTTMGGVTKVAMRQAFHIVGADLVQILGGPPAMREDMVRVGMGMADIRHRGQFDPWAAILPIQFNANVLSVEQVFSLINAGGFAVGVGEWRPERDGVLGRFHVASAKEMKGFT